MRCTVHGPDMNSCAGVANNYFQPNGNVRTLDEWPALFVGQ